MRLILSFDVEIWCNGWSRLDEVFPQAFERYVYGHSRTEGAALPETLRLLRQHGIRAVFFVEPLFAARFGLHYLREIVDLIGSHDQQIELHLHSEWADEISPRPLPHIGEKRQHLQQLDYADQLTLIRMGIDLLREAGVPRLRGFRAGSFAANADTLRAAAAAGLAVDSSINAATGLSVPDLRGSAELHQPSRIGDILSIPLTVFRDGLGRLRPAQVGSCSAAELDAVVTQACADDWQVVMMLSHNFEMLRQGGNRADPIVLRRFKRLCRRLAERGDIELDRADMFEGIAPATRACRVPSVGFAQTAGRVAEQVIRRAIPA
jgi:hypothetical protein